MNRLRKFEDKNNLFVLSSRMSSWMKFSIRQNFTLEYLLCGVSFVEIGNFYVALAS